MDYLFFILLVAFLAGLLYFLFRLEKQAKRQQRKAAYELLERQDASAKEIKQVLKGLRLYGGRWFKDKEFVQLIARLEEHLIKTGEYGR
jgi:cbb3-type cytochrome oxidase subunit 3